MARQVWLVSSGSYSDYRVDAAFSNEAAAEAFVAAMKAVDARCDMDVEDGYWLYDEAPEVHARWEMRQQLLRDGSVTEPLVRCSGEWESHTCRVEVRQHEFSDALHFEAQGCRRDEVEKALRDRVDAYRTTHSPPPQASR